MNIIADNIYQDSYHKALRMQQSGKSRQQILDYLTSAAEKAVGPGAVVSILVLDNKGLLRNGASPQLPEDYLKAIDGIKPDPKVGTCAASAATGEITFTEDFTSDNKWSELRHLPLALGFVGAWSFPIKSKNNKILGTFGTYFREKRLPSETEIQGTGLLASAAAMVLENN
jgi:GAF domain-containing protein